jgi:ankyrin repeat protein
MSEDVSRRDGSANEPVARFIAAAAKGDVDRVRDMLVADPGLVRATGPHPYWGGTPAAIHVAAEWGRLDVLRLLLATGADPNVDSAAYDGWTPLLCAIGKPDVVDLLIEHGARVDAWAAAGLGDEERLREIIAEDPAVVRALGPNEATPLHFASTEAVARLLVERGADLDVRDKYGSTPVRTVAYGGARKRAAGEYLVAAAGVMDVFLATALGDVTTVGKLVSGEPRLVRALDDGLGPASTRGGSALHIAAALGETDVARVLLDAGADPNALSRDGDAPLHYAAKGGHADVADLLVERGARLNLRDRGQNATPADWADFFGQPELAGRLA